jgi:hypothetical protein
MGSLSKKINWTFWSHIFLNVVFNLTTSKQRWYYTTCNSNDKNALQKYATMFFLNQPGVYIFQTNFRFEFALLREWRNISCHLSKYTKIFFKHKPMIHLFTNKNLSEFSLEKSFCYTFYYTLAVTIVCRWYTRYNWNKFSVLHIFWYFLTFFTFIKAQTLHIEKNWKLIVALNQKSNKVGDYMPKLLKTRPILPQLFSKSSQGHFCQNSIFDVQKPIFSQNS